MTTHSQPLQYHYIKLLVYFIDLNIYFFTYIQKERRLISVLPYKSKGEIVILFPSKWPPCGRDV